MKTVADDAFLAEVNRKAGRCARSWKGLSPNTGMCSKRCAVSG